jgi:hypothetical protein
MNGIVAYRAIVMGMHALLNNSSKTGNPAVTFNFDVIIGI